MADRIQQRRDTAARWEQYNPILLEGEIGWVTDNPNQYKIGDGERAWNDLPLRGYSGTVAQTPGDDETSVMSQKAVTDEDRKIMMNTLPDRSFSSFVNIDYNHLYSISESNGIYVESTAYDCAWLQIFGADGTGKLEISGAVVTRINFFNSLEPPVEANRLGSANGLNPSIPAGAKMALITLSKESNPDGYGNMKVLQPYAGATRQDLYDFKIETDNAQTSLIEKFLPDRSFSGFVSIHENHIMNWGTGNVWDGYKPSTMYDSAWVQIFSSGGNLEITGAVVTRVNYFRTLDEPKEENYISNATTATSVIPEGAKLAIITLSKSSNPNGYLDMKAIQPQCGATRESVDAIPEMIQTDAVGNVFTLHGGYLNVNTGNLVNNDAYDYTPYLFITRKEDIVVAGYNTTGTSGGTVTPLCFYDKNFQFISGYTGPNFPRVYTVPVADIPENAVYIRACRRLPENAIAYVKGCNVASLANQMYDLVQLFNNSEKRYLQVVTGKNLLNPDDFLYGKTYSSSSGWVDSADGILSNKLYLSPGKYTIKGVKPYGPFTVRLAFFDDNDEPYLTPIGITIDETTLVGTVNITTALTDYNYSAYARVVLQYDKTYPLDVNAAQFEKGEIATAYEPAQVKLYDNPAYENKPKFAFLTGASNAMPGNGWFEHACNKLGYRCRNVAISGQSVMQAATLAWRGQLYTPEELEEIDFFVTSHTHNYNVCYENPLSTILCDTVEEYESKGYDSSNNPLTVPPDPTDMSQRIVPEGGAGAPGTYSPNDTYNERYSAGYDYLLKKYIKDCYELRNNPNSKWYGTKTGKPVRIIICSYWHDGYKVFNHSAEKLARKFGAVFCNIADNIGLSYKQTNPFDASSIRRSALYCDNASFGSGNDTETIPIDGVQYTLMGWHSTRDKNSVLMEMRGNILAACMLYGNTSSVSKYQIDDLKSGLEEVFRALIAKPKGKNFLNNDDFLYGWVSSNGVWTKTQDGAVSNKLFLEKGITYTIQGITPYGTNNANYINYFDSDDNFISRDILPVIDNKATFVYTPANGTAYARINIRANNTTTLYGGYGQLEKGSVATEYEPYLGTVYTPNFNLKSVNTGEETSKGVLLTGASFAYSGNQWFNKVVQALGIIGYNKAVSGETIADTADKMNAGTLYTSEEFEQFGVLLIFHSHNTDVFTPSSHDVIKPNYSDYTFPMARTTDGRVAAWDYVLKKYAADCYNAKDNPSSKWYGHAEGKPCIVAVITHWHDARTIFNDSIRQLRDKWGFHLIELDKEIGFSKNQLHPVTGEQVSIIHAVNNSNDTEVIDGVTYGWHPTRKEDAYVQIRIAEVVSDNIKKLTKIK